MSTKSPYWSWVQQFANRDDAGSYTELPEANPDVLSDDPKYWNNVDEENQRHRKELIQRFSGAFNKLSKMQRKVIFALAKHNTQVKAAKSLGVSQKTVSVTLGKVKEILDKEGIFSSSEGIK